MNRADLQRLSRQRRKEARTLLQRGLYPGAYYLIGYAVECGLKACIAKQTNRHDFPDKKLANSAYTHVIEELLKLAGLDKALKDEFKVNSTLETNWLIVKDWKEVSRYESGITKLEAEGMYSASVARKNGILRWISDRW